MLKIRQMKKKQDEEKLARSQSSSPAPLSTSDSKVTPAQLRVQKDITELDLPPSIKVTFPNPNDFFNFKLKLIPQEGYYKNGQFEFKIEINSNFPIDPPKIKCLQKIYHPNIDLQGNICLNILREDWSPVLNLNGVFMGLNILFLEPNPNDPLNKDAANMLVKDKKQFARNVYNSMRGGFLDSVYYDRVI